MADTREQGMNINDYVEFDLTKHGHGLYRAYHGEYSKNGIAPLFTGRMQLWEVMQIFGTMAFNGSMQIFVDNEIIVPTHGSNTE